MHKPQDTRFFSAVNTPLTKSYKKDQQSYVYSVCPSQGLKKGTKQFQSLEKPVESLSMRRFFLTASMILLAGLLSVHADSDRLLQTLKPLGHVNDFAGVMRPSDRTSTEGILTELEQKSGAQVVVVSVKSLDGGQIDDFAVRLFERWGIGQKGRDNGLLLVAAIEDRKVRIEVGYGFEGDLPDAATGRLIDQYIVPAFRRGDYSGGLRDGAKALASVAATASGVKLTGVPDQSSYSRSVAQEHNGPGIIQLIVFIIIIIAVIRHPWLLLLMMMSGGGGSRGGGGFGGGGFGGFGGGMSGGGGASRGW
jgi:uncharacterized protein